MNVFLQLIKITSSSVEPAMNEKMKSKVFATVMTILIVLLIFIPVSFFVGFIVYVLTHELVSAANLGVNGAVDGGLAILLHIIAIFSMVFGFNVVMSVFYFSSDLDYLLPLPISPMKIVGAKLASTMLSENVMECILVLSALVGYLIGYAPMPGLNIVGIISAAVGVLTFPIIPISYCAVICMIVMYFSKFLKNKDRVSKLTAFSTIIILAVLVICLNLSNGFDTNLFVEQLLNDDIKMLGVLDIIFFNVPLLTSAVSGSIVSLLLYIIANAAAIGVVLLAASKLYFKAVVSLNGGQGKSEKAVSGISDFENKIKSSSHLMTYFKKELLILVRTPAYLSNCVGINLIWPIFIYLFIVMQKQNDILGGYVSKLKAGDPSAVLNTSLLIFGISVILTALNCLASSAITREGRHFDVMRYLPVDLMTQINSKALVSIVISGAGLIVYIITAFIIFGISPMLTTYCVILSILSVISTTYLGIYIDTMNPKLIWEDEVNALRGNYHVFYNMALDMIITAAICVSMRFLFWLDFLPVAFLQTLILLAAALMTFGFYALCKKKGVSNLLKVEM